MSRPRAVSADHASSPSRPAFGSGPLGRISGTRGRASRVIWRPLLAVLTGMLMTIAAALIGADRSWNSGAQASAALIATLILVLPTCWLEARTRCLIAVVPCVALLEPFTTWWAGSAVWALALLAAWWLRHRELQAVPAGLKQRQLAKQLERYPILHNACLALATTKDPDDVARTLAAQAMRLGIGTLAATVHLQQEGQGLRLRARQGLAPASANDSGEDDTAFVAREGRPLIRRQGPQLRMRYPLREQHGGAGPSGVLDVCCVHDASVDDYNAELQEALARMGGIALGTVDLLQQTRSLALRDSLTGLLGQHEFRRRGRELLAECARLGHLAALILCDLDHLKRYNDAYGHLQGDRALVAVASSLQGLSPLSAGANMLLGRWGGEEFVLLITAPPNDLANDGTSGGWALDIAENIRCGVAQTVIEEASAERQLTTSIGIALWQPTEAFDALLERADQACYTAKNQGRNRCHVADQDRPC